MRKLFCETLAYNLLVFVDENRKAIAFDCRTIQEAKVMDCCAVVGEKNIEALAINCNKNPDDIFTFNEDDFENVTEI